MKNALTSKNYWAAGVLMSLVLILLVCTAAKSGNDNSELRTISVTGSINLETAPDQISWYISLCDTDKELGAARKRNDEKIKKLIAAAKILGVAEGDLSTGPINVRREYERDQNGNIVAFKHFVVTRSANIVQHDFKRTDEYLDAFMGAEDFEVSFNYSSSKIQELRYETRLKAIKKAKEKAEAMAEAAGAKLGRALSISEHKPDSGNYGGYMGYMQSPYSNAAYVESRPSPDDSSATFIPGSTSEQITVYVTFEIE